MLPTFHSRSNNGLFLSVSSFSALLVDGQSQFPKHLSFWQTAHVGKQQGYQQTSYLHFGLLLLFCFCVHYKFTIPSLKRNHKTWILSERKKETNALEMNEATTKQTQLSIWTALQLIWKSLSANSVRCEDEKTISLRTKKVNWAVHDKKQETCRQSSQFAICYKILNQNECPVLSVRTSAELLMTFLSQCCKEKISWYTTQLWTLAKPKVLRVPGN